MGKSTPQPDNSAVIAAQASAEAAKAQYQLGKDQLDWAKQQWGEEQPLISEVTSASAESQKQANAFAAQQHAQYQNEYVPLQEQYTRDVQNYDSPAQEAVNAGAARGAVADNMAAQKQAAQEHLESFGVDPTAARYGGLTYGLNAAEGAAEAGAGTSAIQQTRLQGLQLKSGDIQLGQGLPANFSGLTSAGTGAGATAAGATSANLGAGSSAMTGATQFTNAGTNAMNTNVNAVNGYNTAAEQGYATSMAGSNGIGSAIGGILGSMMPTNGIMGFDEGGPTEAIPTTPGGAVPAGASPTQGIQTDDVPAKLTVGEFVMPKDVVQWLGQKHFVGQIDKARRDQAELNQRRDIGGRPTQAIPTQPTFVSRPQAIPTRRAA